MQIREAVSNLRSISSQLVDMAEALEDGPSGPVEIHPATREYIDKLEAQISILIQDNRDLHVAKQEEENRVKYLNAKLEQLQISIAALVTDNGLDLIQPSLTNVPPTQGPVKSAAAYEAEMCGCRDYKNHLTPAELRVHESNDLPF